MPGKKGKIIVFRSKKLILKTCLDGGYSVIIDGIHATVKHRKVYIDIAKKHDAIVYLLDFGSGTVESLNRRCKENRGLSKVRWRMVHKFYENLYEPIQQHLEHVDTVVDDPYSYFDIRRK